LPRSDFGAGFANGESDDGGFEEFRLFCPSRRVNLATSARSISTMPTSAAFSAASSS
jgi:hypothetical protein